MIDSSGFIPDWASPPGETVADMLEERRVTAEQFARRVGRTLGQVKELLEGRAPLTNQIAQKLALILDVPATFWIVREAQYRQDLARIQGKVRDEVAEQWLAELPVADMINFGWLPKVKTAADKLAACFRFFDIADMGEWAEAHQRALEFSAFRTSPSFDSQQGAVSAWLRQGEIMSTGIACLPWDRKRFEQAIPSILPLTRKKDPSRFIPELTRVCAECGVAVVLVRAPTGCRASGATRFLSPTKALLLLSFRYLSDDHFWFTFFHEAGHLLLHSESALFLEGVNVSSKQEDEANEFAATTLIPAEFSADLLSLRADPNEVIKFSQRVGVSPGIVVGQLQHQRRIKHSQLNSLKRRFQWE
jgi:plasmid maintenance system antidote protein VapI